MIPEEGKKQQDPEMQGHSGAGEDQEGGFQPQRHPHPEQAHSEAKEMDLYELTMSKRFQWWHEHTTYATFGWGLYTAVAVYSVNAAFAVVSMNAFIAILSVNAVFSLLSVNSFASILSVNSAFAIGCANEAFKICI